jgi:hypothetical protein
VSDQLLGILIPAIAVIVSALIAAVAQAGKGRDTAVLLALLGKDDEIHRLENQIRDLKEDTPDDRPDPRPPHG